MSLAEFPILVASYEDEDVVKRALQKLQQAGFNDEQIGMLMRNGRLMPVHIHDALVNIGVPEEEADIYEREFQCGHIILLVRHDGRAGEAFQSLFELTITGVSISIQEEDQARGSSASDEAESLWRLLKAAGLEHLL